jgi:hypothetical protein
MIVIMTADFFRKLGQTGKISGCFCKILFLKITSYVNLIGRI